MILNILVNTIFCVIVDVILKIIVIVNIMINIIFIVNIIISLSFLNILQNTPCQILLLMQFSV